MEHILQFSIISPVITTNQEQIIPGTFQTLPKPLHRHHQFMHQSSPRPPLTDPFGSSHGSALWMEHYHFLKTCNVYSIPTKTQTN